MTMKVDGKRIRQLRLDRSWSQEWLAEKAGVSLRTIQRMETDSVASLQSRRAVADALDVRATELDVDGPLAGDELASGRGTVDAPAERESIRHESGPGEPGLRPASRERISIGLRQSILVVGLWTLLFIAGIGGSYYWLTRPTLEPDRARSIEPTVVTVAYGDIENGVVATGTIRPRDIVPVTARTSGELSEILVDIGDSVTAGQVLARLDATEQQLRVQLAVLELQKLKNLIAQYEQSLALSQKELERAEMRHQAGTLDEQVVAASRQQFVEAQTMLENGRLQVQQSETELEQRQIRLNYTEIKSPIAGTVIAIEQKAGTIFDDQHEPPVIFRIADLAKLTVDTEISEADISALQDSPDVYIETLGTGEQRWPGSLRAIDPIPSKSDIVVYSGHIDVDNAEGRLFWGQSARTHFVTSSARDVLVVPVSALSYSDGPDETGSPHVQVVLPDGASETREITIGLTDRANAEVTDGLSAGERVIASQAEPNT